MTDTVAAKAPEAGKLNCVESYVRSKERRSEGRLANSRDGTIQAMREDFHSVLHAGYLPVFCVTHWLPQTQPPYAL